MEARAGDIATESNRYSTLVVQKTHTGISLSRFPKKEMTSDVRNIKKQQSQAHYIPEQHLRCVCCNKGEYMLLKISGEVWFCEITIYVY